MKLSFDLELPDGAVDDRTQPELVRSIKEQAVQKLYSDQRITAAEAASALSVSRLQFLDLLRTSGVGFRVELDEQDFASFVSRATAAGWTPVERRCLG
jgi:hypothetical protein